MIKKINLFDAFRNAMLANPNASRKEAFESFLETVKSSPAYLEALASDYFHQMERQWKLDQDAKTGSHSLIGTPAMQRRAELSAERRAESADRVAEAKTALAETIRPFIWLEMLMPNGKKLRYCTGAELAKFGGAFLEMSKHLKPSQVVDKHLSETDLRNIYSRFGSKRRSAAGVELRA